MEALQQSEANLVVYLHPSKSGSPGEAILGELSSLLFTYNESLDGVVLAYDPKISSNLAHIIPGISPNIGVELRAQLLMFRPKAGMIVEGEVVAVTSNSINAVVLGFASASVNSEDVRGEFRFKRSKEVYVSRLRKKHKVRVGTILRFRVKSFDGETLHVEGSMVGEDTGCARWLDANVEVWNEVERSGVRRRVGEGEEKEEQTKNVTEEMVELKDGEKSKKAKKRRVKEEEQNGFVNEDGKPKNVKEMVELTDGEKSKKAKKRRVKEEEQNGLVNEDGKPKNVKLREANEKEEAGVEVKEEMAELKDGEKSNKSKKSKKKRVKKEEENGLVKNEEMPSLEEDEKPKKLKKRRKEQK